MVVKCIKNKLADFEEGPLKSSLRKVIHLDEQVFFEIIDSRPSKYWNFVFDSHTRHQYGLLFPEWAEDTLFYESLLDGDQKEEMIFSEYKRLLDDESKERF